MRNAFLLFLEWQLRFIYIFLTFSTHCAARMLWHIALKSNFKVRKMYAVNMKIYLFFFVHYLNEGWVRTSHDYFIALFIYLFSRSEWHQLLQLCVTFPFCCCFSLSDSHFVCVWVRSWNVFVFFPTNTSNQNKITVAMDDFGGVVTLTPFHLEIFPTVIMVKLRVL